MAWIFTVRTHPSNPCSGTWTKVDPAAAKRARLRYSCFDHFSRNPQEYGYATTVGAVESCENAVVEQLIEFQQKAAEFLSRDGEAASEELFFAEQNARLV